MSGRTRLASSPFVRPAARALGLTLVGVVALELVMRPSGRERLEPAVLFAGIAVLEGVLAWWFARRAGRHRSLRSTVALVGLLSVTLIALAVALASWRMFLSGHDLRLLAVLLVFAGVAGALFAVSVAGTLTADLRAVRRTADRVGAGDFECRTGITRGDELGAAAAALDLLAERLGQAAADRRHDEEARRHLLASVGHDLRTPLAAMQAAIEALQDGLADDPERYLRSLGHDVAALSTMVDDLFLLTRIEAGELVADRQPLDLAELADETIEVLEPVARREGVTLRLDATDPARVLGGSEALGRVLRNLVDNAIRYAAPSGHVLVRVRNGDGATVEVVDDGPGFPPELLVTAFDRFVRADSSRSRETGGAGLGLAIAREVIQAHGGTISALPGPGGRVVFHLPPADAPGVGVTSAGP